MGHGKKMFINLPCTAMTLTNLALVSTSRGLKEEVTREGRLSDTRTSGRFPGN